MIYEVVISNEAEKDLRGIYEYIAFDLLSPENASGQLKRLEDSIMGLGKMPNRFRAYESEPWHSRGLRQLPVDNYVVFYISDEETQVVNVVRVMYSGRDIDNVLNE